MAYRQLKSIQLLLAEALDPILFLVIQNTTMIFQLKVPDISRPCFPNSIAVLNLYRTKFSNYAPHFGHVKRLRLLLLYALLYRSDFTV